MLSIALAVAPGIAISLFIYSLNKYGKASLGSLVVCFLLGMVATLPPFLVQMLASDVRDGRHYHSSILSFAWYAFAIVALSEEGSKWLVLRGYAFSRKGFTGPFDGIVYGVMTGMGFATIENIEYVWQFGYETGLARFFLSVPAHGAFGVLMGYNLGLAKVRPQRAVRLMGKGLLIAVLFHGSFDFFLFLQQSHEATKYVSTGLLSFGAFATFYIAVRLALSAIRMHRKEEEDAWEDGEHGSDRAAVADAPVRYGHGEEDVDQRAGVNPGNALILANEETSMTSEPSITIRLADQDDINTIGFLAQQIWPPTYGKILSAEQLQYMLNLIYSPTSLRQQMREQQFLILEEDEEPIGFASWSPGADPSVYKLHKLYVQTGRQGKGLGKTILDFITGDIVPQGARALQLNVNRHNKARQFYERMGFKVIREEDIDIGNNYFMNDYVMELPL